MRQIKPILSIILMVSFGLTGLKAQTMYVRETNGMQTPFNLSSIKKMTFALGNMTVKQTGGSTTTYPLANLRYVNFMDLTVGNYNAENEESSNFILFPNPANNELIIKCSSSNDNTVDIDIISIDGKVICQKILNAQLEKGQLKIGISSLPNGLYLCSIRNGKAIKTIKFIKS